MGMFLRRGVRRVFDVIMSWSFSNSDERNYVTIDGTKYSAKGAVSAPEWTIITVTAYGASSSAISHDGVTVANGAAGRAISYTFKLTSPTTIAYTSAPSTKVAITTS